MCLCRLILIAERQTVYNKFPTPLINRLEKHFVLSKTLLEDWQNEILKRLNAWIEAFITVVKQKDQFLASDVFVGYKDDTPAAVVLQATKNLDRTVDSSSWNKRFHERKHQPQVSTL